MVRPREVVTGLLTNENIRACLEIFWDERLCDGSCLCSLLGAYRLEGV